MKKMRYIFSALAVFLMLTAASAYDISQIKAYPVPFNPKSEALKIAVPAVAPAVSTDYRVILTIYDVNGDSVTQRSYSSAGILTWNGRNKRGTIVKPGLYVIKIIVENDGDGDYGKKLLRILVKY